MADWFWNVGVPLALAVAAVLWIDKREDYRDRTRRDLANAIDNLTRELYEIRCPVVADDDGQTDGVSPADGD